MLNLSYLAWKYEQWDLNLGRVEWHLLLETGILLFLKHSK